MNSLTIGLAAVGGIGLAAVVAHGAWTARRAGPKPPTPASDAVGEPREPTLDGPDARAADGSDPTAVGSPTDASELGRFEPAADVPGVASAPSLRPGPRIDPGIDALAVLTLDTPQSGDLVLAHLPAVRRAGTKPMLVEALDVETHQFEPPRAGRRYSELHAAVQLANSTGPLNEIEYSEFVQQLQSFADSVNATADIPDMLDVVARAREIDTMASECDAQLAVHLRARDSAWSVAYVQQQAARFGFVLGAVPGRLVVASSEEGAPPVLTLSFDAQGMLVDGTAASAIREVVLHLDVPQIDPQVGPFALWQSTAEVLARHMDADLLDDSGRPLATAAFVQIGQELETLYGRLAAHDLPAGSVAARRLFS